MHVHGITVLESEIMLASGARICGSCEAPSLGIAPMSIFKMYKHAQACTREGCQVNAPEACPPHPRINSSASAENVMTRRSHGSSVEVRSTIPWSIDR